VCVEWREGGFPSSTSTGRLMQKSGKAAGGPARQLDGGRAKSRVCEGSSSRRSTPGGGYCIGGAMKSRLRQKERVVVLCREACAAVEVE
jgi:hypothetical protein